MSAPRPVLDPAGTWAIVPVRGLERSKSRLAGPLDAEERLDLVSRLLARAIAATTSSARIAGTIVVSGDPRALEQARAAGAVAVRDLERGLNPALDLARTEAIARGASALVVLPADLPYLDRATLEAVLDDAGAGAAAAGTGVAVRSPVRPGRLIALVTDRHGTGTNVLILVPPTVIEFAFGPGSRATHAAAAEAAGATYVELRGPLDVDLDTPEDFVLVETFASEPIDVG